MKVKGLQKVNIVIGTFLLAFISSVVPVSAHQSGCHRWHSCPSDSGSYVCGDLGYTSECGTTPSAAPTYAAPPAAPAPKQPTVSTKTVVVDEPLAYKTIAKKNNKEYVGYKKVTKKGKSGKQRTTYEVTLSDGVETSRKKIKSVVTSKPVDEKAVVGTRKKPTSKPAPTNAKQASSTSAANVYYKNCTEARAAGVTPITTGQPGYRAALDRDSDGIACE